jgi:hypothetical protein
MNWARILAFVTGMVDQELVARIEYLAAEKCLIRGRPGLRRALEPSNLQGNKLAVPGQRGVRPGHIGHLVENLTTQSMTDLAERAMTGLLGHWPMQDNARRGRSGTALSCQNWTLWLYSQVEV